MKNERYLMKWYGGASRNLMVGLLGVLLLSFGGCKKDPIKFETTFPTVDEEAVQYDVPFSGVPATADIQLYEVNVQAFSAKGDFAGVQERLDEIKDLGVNVIWLMPTYPIGQLKGVGSPYAIKDYMAVNSTFGDLESLRSLVKEAHARDMAVILDWVGNHTAWDNVWMANADWYERDTQGAIVSSNGWADIADLNYNSSGLRKAVIKAMKYWVLEANVDGYRCDFAEGVPTDFWKDAIDALRGLPNRDIIMFAESGEKGLLDVGFDMIFGWSYYDKLKSVFSANASASTVFATNTSDYAGLDEGKEIVRWITNHDQNAWDGVPQDFFVSKAGTLAAFVATSYLRGVPLLYNGQEVGNANKISFFANSVNKINWGLNLDMKTAYTRLLQYRKGSNVVKKGALKTFGVDADVLVFEKSLADKKVLVLVNTRNKAVTYTLPVELANTSWTDAFLRSTKSLGASVELGAFEYLVLEN